MPVYKGEIAPLFFPQQQRYLIGRKSRDIEFQELIRGEMRERFTVYHRSNTFLR